MGKNSPNKGYIYGIRLSILTIFIFIIFGLIFNNLNTQRLIYFLIISFTITCSSILGINKKTK